MEPSPAQSPLALVNENEDRLMGLLFGQLVDHKCVTVAAGRLTSGKLRGVSPDFIPRLAAKCAHLTIIVEADGAAGRSLKAPNSTEPVVPKNTSLVIPVVGLDALGTEMTEANVFRAQLASGLLRKILGSRVTAEDIANLVTCDNGIARTSPVYARVTPMINKADSKRALMKAEGIAENILAANHRQIGRVVLGRLRSPNRTWVVGQ
jgi:probable selenium-dependent hydroxylase accessory protein YqeC